MIGTPDAAAVSGKAEEVSLVVDEEESVGSVRSAPDCLSVSPAHSTVVSYSCGSTPCGTVVCEEPRVDIGLMIARQQW